MHTMSCAERVISTLYFLTGKGMNHYPHSCDRSTIKALISDYFNEVQSDDKNNHRNEGKVIIIKINTRNHLKTRIKHIVAASLACYIRIWVKVNNLKINTLFNNILYKQKIWHGIKFDGWQYFVEITKFNSPIANSVVFYYTLWPWIAKFNFIKVIRYWFCQIFLQPYFLLIRYTISESVSLGDVDESRWKYAYAKITTFIITKFTYIVELPVLPDSM